MILGTEKGGRDTGGKAEDLTRAAPGPMEAHDPVDALLGVHEELSAPQLGPTLGSRQARAHRGPRPLPAVSSDGHRLHFPFYNLGGSNGGTCSLRGGAEDFRPRRRLRRLPPLTVDPPPKHRPAD